MSESNEHFTCDQCGAEEATIHMTEFVEGRPVQRHLCESCYSDQSDLPSLSSSKIFQQILSALAPELEEVSSRECPRCGMTYLEFRQEFTFGCPGDYEVFSEPLDELLEQIHGANRHVGRTPSGQAQRGAVEPRLEVLRRELEEAVQREEFEEAAVLRDEITQLEQQSAGDTDQ